MNPLEQHYIDEHIQERANLINAFSALPEPEYSSAYQQRKAEHIGRHKKSRPGKVAFTVIALCILFSILAACAQPMREFIIEIYEQFTSYFSSGQAYPIAELQIEFRYLPEGYKLSEEVVQETFYKATYKKKGEESGVLTITIDSSSKTFNYLNNENMEEAQYEVNGNTCIIMRHDKEPEKFLYCDTVYAAVEIYGVLTEDELRKLAEEMRITMKE